MTKAFRVALATNRDFPQLCDDDRLLVRATEAAGGTAVPEQWSEADVRWDAYDGVVIRSTWDYYERLGEFRRWLDRLEALGVRVFNDVPTLRGNLDKAYLRGLEARGIETVPTVWVDAGASPAEVQAALAQVPWDEVVVKPSVSAGAFRTVRTTRAALLADQAPLLRVVGGPDGSAAMIQPFLPEILAEGEWSFLYFGGEFSHAALKTPKAGDYRVQWRHGGTQVGRTAPAGVRPQAERVLAAAFPDFATRPPLYARVDGVVRGGRLLLVELELIEPFLFLGQDPEAASRFAAALSRAVR